MPAQLRSSFIQRLFTRKLPVIAALLLSLYFITPMLLTNLARTLIRQDELRPADVVIALSGDAECRRELQAAELYRQGLAKKIVVGGISYDAGFHTGEAARRLLIHRGIPEADIFVLLNTTNTRTEAAAFIELMRQHNWQTALVVTDPYHSRRALYTLETVAADVTFLSAPLAPGNSPWQPERWWSRRDDLWLTVREALSWINTLIGGLR